MYLKLIDDLTGVERAIFDLARKKIFSREEILFNLASRHNRREVQQAFSRLRKLGIIFRSDEGWYHSAY